MVEFIDHVAGQGQQGKYKLTHSDNSFETVKLELQDSAVENGTALNRGAMMKIQGFDNASTSIVYTSTTVTTITQTASTGTLTTVVTDNENGTYTIVETFVGSGSNGKTIRKTTSVNTNNNTISEQVSEVTE